VGKIQLIFKLFSKHGKITLTEDSHLCYAIKREMKQEKMSLTSPHTTLSLSLSRDEQDDPPQTIRKTFTSPRPRAAAQPKQTQRRRERGHGRDTAQHHHSLSLSTPWPRQDTLWSSCWPASAFLCLLASILPRLACSPVPLVSGGHTHTGAWDGLLRRLPRRPCAGPADLSRRRNLCLVQSLPR
jgi:hypothetical protein